MPRMTMGQLDVFLREARPPEKEFPAPSVQGILRVMRSAEARHMSTMPVARPHRWARRATVGAAVLLGTGGAAYAAVPSVNEQLQSGGPLTPELQKTLTSEEALGAAAMRISHKAEGTLEWAFVDVSVDLTASTVRVFVTGAPSDALEHFATRVGDEEGVDISVTSVKPTRAQLDVALDAPLSLKLPQAFTGIEVTSTVMRDDHSGVLVTYSFVDPDDPREASKVSAALGDWLASRLGVAIEADDQAVAPA